MTSKVAHLWQFGFFFLCSLECPKQPRIDNSFYRFLYPMICGTISGAEMNEVQARQVILGTITKKMSFEMKDPASSVIFIDERIFHFVYDGLSHNIRFDEK